VKALRGTTLAMALLCAGGCSERVSLGPGLHAPAPPQQSVTGAEAFDHRGYRLAPQARFEATGKVLGKRRYRWDSLADLVPWDLALGWGILSDEENLQTLRFSQGDRYLFWDDWARRLPKPEVDRSSANIHVVPASPQVLAQLDSLPVGALVALRGQLVDAHDLQRPRRYFTSLTRDDTGGGACEILFLEELRVLRTDALAGGN
jgi:hypothetical protein